jgi:DNA-binding response OmpR family regulator
MNTLPTGVPDPAPRPRILLVEDNEAASKGLARLLEAWGFDVTIRRDGASGLEALETAPPPDFLLTDLQLPDLDGRELALRARALDPRPRVALITGWDLDSEESSFEPWGIDWVFPKPLDTRRLLARLREPRPGPEIA